MMKIAYTMAPGRGDTDLLLQKVATEMAARGYRTSGTVQINTEDACDGPCDMDVMVLPDGPIMRISQDLGRASKGCRLDPAVLETAVGQVTARLEEGADLLIINKFGKHEASGRGFRMAIAEALSRDIVVLVGVNALNLDAFKEFVGPDAVSLPPEAGAINAWFDSVLRVKEGAA